MLTSQQRTASMVLLVAARPSNRLTIPMGLSRTERTNVRSHCGRRRRRASWLPLSLCLLLACLLAWLHFASAGRVSQCDPRRGTSCSRRRRRILAPIQWNPYREGVSPEPWFILQICLLSIEPRRDKDEPRHRCGTVKKTTQGSYRLPLLALRPPRTSHSIG